MSLMSSLVGRFRARASNVRWVFGRKFVAVAGNEPPLNSTEHCLAFGNIDWNPFTESHSLNFKINNFFFCPLFDSIRLGKNN